MVGLTLAALALTVASSVVVEWLRKKRAVDMANISKAMFLSAINKPECAEARAKLGAWEVVYKAKK